MCSQESFAYDAHRRIAAVAASSASAAALHVSLAAPRAAPRSYTKKVFQMRNLLENTQYHSDVQAYVADPADPAHRALVRQLLGHIAVTYRVSAPCAAQAAAAAAALAATSDRAAAAVPAGARAAACGGVGGAACAARRWRSPSIAAAACDWSRAGVRACDCELTLLTCVPWACA
jgi:hypothetical protein